MFKPGESPIPDYSLLRLLGRAQYGEVWEAEVPGGTHLAIKFIPLQDKKGHIELRSIQAVKLIRHANLIPIHAIWLLDTDGKVMESESLGRAVAAATHKSRADETLVAGAHEIEDSLAYLVICMSMADQNLQDRLEQEVQNGQSGIPADELLEYVRQAAIGLDFLNSPKHLVDEKTVGIQHRDVKPANLLLMGDTVVVGDFGVATTLKEYDATATAALGSLAFMAPESLSRKPSQTSDQYALAITYYQLRSNSLPYDPNVSLSELIAIHSDGRLDFSNVSESEQRVLKKATSTDPASRYDSCRELADALIECHKGESPQKRSTPPAIAATTAVVAIGIVTILLLDPFKWFADTDTARVSPKQNYVLAISPSDVAGNLTIQHKDSDDIVKSLSETNNLKLDGSEQIWIKAESDNPFFGSVDGSYTFEQLSQQNWIIELPEITRSEFLADVDQLLDAGHLDQASRLYTSGAMHDASLKSLPNSSGEAFENPIHKFAVARSKSSFAVSVRDQSGNYLPSLLTLKDGRLESQTFPTSSQPQNSLIESLLFAAGDQQLIIVRQDSIQSWNADTNAVERWLGSDGAGQQRWMGGSVSSDGRWLAINDSNDNVQVLDLSSNSSSPSLKAYALDQRIVQMLFDLQNELLTVVGETLPLQQAKINESQVAPLNATNISNPLDISGEFIIDASVVGKDSLVLAGEQSVIVGLGFFSKKDKQLEIRKEFENASVSLLRATPEKDWFLVCTDSSPSAVLWNVHDSEPAETIESHEINAIHEANFSRDGKWVVISSRDGSVKLLDLRRRPYRLIDFKKFDDGYVQFAGFSADSKYLIAVIRTASSDGSSPSQVFYWDFQRCWLALDAQQSLGE